MHDDDSNRPDKDGSKHLKWRQIEAIHTGVRDLECPLIRVLGNFDAIWWIWVLRSRLILSILAIWSVRWSRSKPNWLSDSSIKLRLMIHLVRWFGMPSQSGFRLYLLFTLINTLIFKLACSMYLLLVRISMQSKTLCILTSHRCASLQYSLQYCLRMGNAIEWWFNTQNLPLLYCASLPWCELTRKCE